jgi:hypothetical protein
MSARLDLYALLESLAYPDDDTEIKEYGIKRRVWRQAVNKITEILRDRAKNFNGQETISYSDLYAQIGPIIRSSPVTGPEDKRFHAMLGEVSTREHSEGRGMLTVLVVHQSGDMRPGIGFFQLAKDLGIYFGKTRDDKEVFWINEFKKVLSFWRGKSL